MFEIQKNNEVNIDKFIDINPKNKLTYEQIIEQLGNNIESYKLSLNNTPENKKEIETKQKSEIEKIDNGEQNLETKNEKGNYGEMKVDQDLKSKGYDRISKDVITEISENGHHGIDGVYYKKDGEPQYIIVDAKYGSATLNEHTADGKQMSEKWIDSRLDNSVGKEKADEIRMEKLTNPDNVGSYVCKVSSNGDVSYNKLDNNANTIQKDVKVNA